MAPESSVPASTRPRLWLLILLGIAVVAFAAVQMWPSPSAAPVTPTSNSRAARKGASGTVDPASLNVRLDDLQGKRPSPGAAERNPFRFQPKPPPPPPPQPRPESGGERGAAPQTPPVPAGPPPPPPIPLKFFGIVEKPGAGKLAAFTDCRSTYYGREGEVVAGQYRLVKIGIESVVMEYTDGRGRATIRLSGQECVSK